LDFLRSVAVLLVVVSHVANAPGWFWLPFRTLAPLGYLGVLLFFVHTSLVLMFSMERQLAKGSDRFATSFLVRRIFRILPLSMIVLTAVVAFSIPAVQVYANHVAGNSTDTTGYLASLFLVQNIVVSNLHDGEIMGVLWSLPLEMEMYLFLPLLFVFLRPIKRTRTLLVVWLFTYVGSFALQAVFKVIGYTIASFSWGRIEVPDLFIYVPCFLAGVIAYMMWRQPLRRLPFLVLPILIAGIVGTYMTLTHLPMSSVSLDLVAPVYCLALGVTLPSIAEPHNPSLRIVCEQIAKYSYGIYLVHVPSAWVAFDVLGELPFVVSFVAFIIVTSVASVALYHAVEQPGIRFGTRLASKLKRSAPTPAVLVTSSAT
jgi:peptidoglycan/LPS O-acetylase OafA/YrhL